MGAGIICGMGIGITIGVMRLININLKRKIANTTLLRLISKAYYADIKKSTPDKSINFALLFVLKDWFSKKSYNFKGIDISAPYGRERFSKSHFQNVQFSCRYIELEESSLTDSVFKGTTRYIEIENTKLIRVDFSQVKPKNKSDFSIKFEKMNIDGIDIYTMESIRKLLKEQQLTIDENIVAPDWLTEFLKDENEEEVSN